MTTRQFRHPSKTFASAALFISHLRQTLIFQISWWLLQRVQKLALVFEVTSTTLSNENRSSIELASVEGKCWWMDFPSHKWTCAYLCRSERKGIRKNSMLSPGSINKTFIFLEWNIHILKNKMPPSFHLDAIITSRLYRHSVCLRCSVNLEAG